MSYQITVKANNGSLSVTATGDVPDGEHIVSGHSDGNYVTLAAARRDELGHHVIATQHSHVKAEAAQAAEFFTRP
jgi:hypothetical protein